MIAVIRAYLRPHCVPNGLQRTASNSLTNHRRRVRSPTGSAAGIFNLRASTQPDDEDPNHAASVLGRRGSRRTTTEPACVEFQIDNEAAHPDQLSRSRPSVESSDARRHGG